jgi:1-deoxy-D-xylulose-5-phosphate reductoisomerase
MGRRVALANKESLVMAGDIVFETARQGGGEVIPVDSEHSAVFQLLDGKAMESVRKIILTASGGPFREISPEKLENVSVEEALNHPTWDMGRKITVDSATLANKGLEVIEAHHLFQLEYDRIGVLVHPQSIVHSMVEFVDDSLWAHMSEPDMKIPIQYALTFPERMPLNGRTGRGLELTSLTFEEVRRDIFPILGYAYEAGRRGGTAPAAFNAANEVAVEKFLQREIPFNDITVMVKWALDNHPYVENPDLDKILSVDSWTREKANDVQAGKL